MKLPQVTGMFSFLAVGVLLSMTSTATEYPVPDKGTFSFFDSNGDGCISPEEFAVGRQKMGKRRGASENSRGPRSGMGRHAPLFREFDLDGDGSIAEDEFLEAQSKRISERSQAGFAMRNIGNIPVFADIDTNADGRITPDEFRAHQQQHRKR